MTVEAYRLGVDFGTSTTVAVLAWPDGVVKPLVFDGSELLPSAVCADGDGTLLVGVDALHAARTRPEGFEPHPKRCVDDGTVLLGADEVPVPELFAAVLGRVAAEARRVAGERLGSVTLACPAGWGERRRAVLTAAAEIAGLGTPTLVAEPVAAASRFVAVAGRELPVGSYAVVYDLGAGTFDAAVLRRGATGFEVVAEAGLSDAGGLDVDEAIVSYLGSVFVTRDAERWARLHQPGVAEDRRAARLLRDDVRTGKEMLSRASSTLIRLPLFDDDVPLGREQLELLARPILDRTVRATRAAIHEAGIGLDSVDGLFLVGGSTRMPLVASLLHRALGLAPTVIERPELVVAEGSVLTPADPAILHSGETPEPEIAPAPIVPPPVPVVADSDRPTEPADVERGRRIRRRGVLAAAVVAPAAAAAIVVNKLWSGPDDPGKAQGTSPSSSTGPTGTATPHSRRRTATLADAGAPVAFSPDGHTIATAGPDYSVLLWDVTDPAKPRRTATIRPEVAFVNAVEFSPDGRTLAVAGQGTTPGLWDVSNRARPVRTASLTGFSTGVYDLAFSPDGRTLATGSLKAIVLWKVTNRARPSRAAVLTDVSGAVGQVGFSRNGRLLAAVDGAPSLVLWEFTGGGPRPSRRARVAVPGHGLGLALNADQRTLVTGTDDGTATLWNVADRSRPTKLATVPGETVDFTPDGKTLATATRLGGVRLWDVTDPAQPTSGQGMAGAGVRCGPDGILAVSWTNSVELWR